MSRGRVEGVHGVARPHTSAVASLQSHPELGLEARRLNLIAKSGKGLREELIERMDAVAIPA